MESSSELSDKSQKFIEDLRVYLFSSGKNSDETEEIVEELKTHLIEAESKGKSIERIIGDSPKEYMQSIAGEMPVDYKTWLKYILIIVFGSFSFTIIEDLTAGPLAYSILEIIGHITIGVLFIAALIISFRYISGKDHSNIKQMTILLIPAVLPIALFVGLIYLNREVETPMIYFGFWGSLILALVMLIFIIGISVWSKTLVLPIVLILSTAPEYLLGLTSLQEETQLIWSTLILLGGFAGYAWLVMRLDKNKR